MKASVAIVSCNRPDALDRLLASLLEQTHLPYEVIVINNGSSDATAGTVQQRKPAFARSDIDLRHYTRDDRNLPAGRNDALSHSTGDIVCFLDDDTVASESWLDGIQQGYRNSDAVAVGGPSISVDETLTPKLNPIWSGENQNEFNRFGELQDRTRCWIPPRPVRTELLQGSNMSFRRETLESIGGFDPGYEGYPLFEDQDVMARLRKRDAFVLYHPDALVYHERVAHDDERYYWYWFGRNGLYFRRQNFPETFSLSLLRMLFWKEYSPLSIVKQIALLPYRRDFGRLHGFVRGCFDGLLFDR